MNIAVMGASGFIGQALCEFLLKNTEHNIYALSPNPESMKNLSAISNRFKSIKADVFDTSELKHLLSGMDVAYYLVHLMNGKSSHFYDAEAKAATSFGSATQESGIKKLIYLSGLGKDSDNLSEHLASRHNTGDLLRKYHPLVIEFRASMVIGQGSISFEIVRSLVKKLPVMTLPKWVNTQIQPIGLTDALSYLTQALDLSVHESQVFEIGGPEKMSYEQFLKMYADHIKKRCILIRVPVLPEWLAGWWLDLFTPKGVARVGRHMVASFRNEMVVTNDLAKKFFPNISPKPIADYFD